MVMDCKSGGGTEAQQYVWGGAIPLQIHLHESEVTTLPPPPPALILAPRLGYLPLLVPQIKPSFSSYLPPGVDTVWFEYKGLPLKWYIPTGTLFDLLCAEPERPWNLTIHFRGYPGVVLPPCEGEDNIKWSFINALKEAAYVINGNCKNIMSMSQSDQAELWRSVVNGQLEAYLRVSSKLKLDIVGDVFSLKLNSSTSNFQQSITDSHISRTTRTGRVPVRLYVRIIDKDIDELEDAPLINSWEKISYINRPVEVHDEGKCFTLHDAMKAILPETFTEKPSALSNSCGAEVKGGQSLDVGSSRSNKGSEEVQAERVGLAEIKLVRVQGIEPQLEIPFGWVVNNLMNPEHYLHVCIYMKVLEPVTL